MLLAIGLTSLVSRVFQKPEPGNDWSNRRATLARVRTGERKIV
jgi:hypothetical protein